MDARQAARAPSRPHFVESQTEFQSASARVSCNNPESPHVPAPPPNTPAESLNPPARSKHSPERAAHPRESWPSFQSQPHSPVLQSPGPRCPPPASVCLARAQESPLCSLGLKIPEECCATFRAGQGFVLCFVRHCARRLRPLHLHRQRRVGHILQHALRRAIKVQALIILFHNEVLPHH